MDDRYKQLMLDRLSKRKKILDTAYERAKRKVLNGKVGSEYNRLWLDNQVKGFKLGLDVCCGDFLVDGAEGADIGTGVLGNSFLIEGDALTVKDFEELDYVVCNYIEAFVDPLKLFTEWNRVLKPGGFIAFICMDPDMYTNDVGPLENRNRLNVYTRRTIRCYLARTKFINVEVTDGEDKSFRVKAYKEKNV